ncbi:IS66 family transposase, partial [Aliikangiella coralliicola]
DLVSEYEDYNIIHYGDYEKKYVLHMERKYSFNSCQMVILSKIKQRLLNALSLIYGYVYFPTYGNSLKEIAREIGFNWSSNLSGHKSISLRYQWESSKSKKAMEKLRKYNVEDCLALYEVINFIENSICIEEACDEQVVPAKSLNKKATFKFGNSEYLIKELEYFNKCSYFEYQRDKVFVRKPSKKRKSRVKKRKHKNVRVSTVIDIPYLRVCNRCHCSNVYRHGKLEKVVFDLKFTNFGVSRYIIKYRSDRARCGSCKSVFTSPDYLSIKSKYGSSLQIWVVYQMIALGLTYGKIVEELWSVFGYQVSRQFCYAIKRSMALHYEPTRKQIINNLNKSNAIYADETSINLQGIKGYVWVFVSQTEVLYIFAPTREKKLLDEVLTEFNGVLVSDFYAAYDSYKGPQQKCLIHLVRDMNDDLRAHPFDVDYKSLITELSKLLYEIVSKVDKYGLRKRFLHKYLNKADNFMNKVSCYEGSSEATNKYKNRFTKYKDKLFTFLDYDDVTWNNNYAEHAIKVFAQYRRVADGSFTKNGIEKYLALLSISETCKLRGIDFLDFLKSRKLNLHETSYSSNQKRNT